MSVRTSHFLIPFDSTTDNNYLPPIASTLKDLKCLEEILLII